MKNHYFSTYQLILLALLAVLIVAAGVVSKPGAASLVGLTSALLAGFLGLGDFGALNTFLSYTTVGVGTDLALLLLGKPVSLPISRKKIDP